MAFPGKFVVCVVKQDPGQPPAAEGIIVFCRQRRPHADLPLQVEFVDGLG